MGIEDVPVDEKAKRMRDLLSSFYAPDPSMAAEVSSQPATFDNINSNSFDPDQYMNLLVSKSNLEALLQRHVQMAAEIKNLDTDLQMLVYENYNKFISATDTIKRMKNNIVGMEGNMDQLLQKIMSVQSRSDGVNTSLFEKREHIEKLHRTRNLLRKVQFIYDLPARLQKCIKAEAYSDAVRFYTGAMPIFKAYGESSFQDCKRASDEAIAIIIKNLQGKLFSDSESIQARAEAAVLLKQLDYPVDSLKTRLLEKLEQSLLELQFEPGKISSTLEPDVSPPNGLVIGESTANSNQGSVKEFSEAICAYRVIFPETEEQLIKLAQDLTAKHFDAMDYHMSKRVSAADLLRVFRILWEDVLLLDEVLSEALLLDFALQRAETALKKYVANTFSHLQQDLSDALMKAIVSRNEATEEPLMSALEASKKAILQGSMDMLLDFRKLLDDKLEITVKLRDLVVDSVQEGFQRFFRLLDDHFHQLSGKSGSQNEEHQILGKTKVSDKVHAGLVIVLAQLAVFIEQTAIPRITEEIAASFSGEAVRGYENGPIFVPGEICRNFSSTAERLLHHYIYTRTQKISILLRKRFKTPNWVKHKEPREVHMFVDLFLQELEAVEKEVKQILPHGLRRHHRSDSNGSSASSRSTSLREDKLTRSNTQKARSQLLETHLAKLFKQKVEIFTKVEYTQESVVTAVVKLSLKSLQEYARLQTFNRSGFQQIQLDTQFLRNPLKEFVEDVAVIDFLLDEVIVGASERCLDPIPLEPPILDKLIMAKLAKQKEPNAVSH